MVEPWDREPVRGEYRESRGAGRSRVAGDRACSEDAQHSEKNALLALAIHAGQGSAARLVAAFSRDASFGDLRDGWIQCGGSGMRVQAHMFPHFLISSIIDGHSAKQLIKDARTFAAARRSATEFYTPLGGVTVAAAINLGNDIDLVPWADVPDGYHQTLFHPDGSTSIPPMRAMPNSALRSRSAERQVLFSSYKDAKVLWKCRIKKLRSKLYKFKILCVA